jgi:hypothetical protein
MKKTKKSPRKHKARTETVLVLRVCNADMSSRGGFTWPEIGHVEATDWKPTAECGNGLHGWLWGEGDHGAAKWAGDNKWLVVEVLAKDVVDLVGKVKFPAGEVVHCGDQQSATEYLRAHLPPEKRDSKIIGGTATAGDSGTATAGDSGTATAGDSGTATAGDSGTATAGDSGTATAGDRGTATAGYSGTATAGDRGTATAGYRGTATAGYSGTATAGDSGTATAGYSGTATAGDSGTATAGDSGTATAGDSGTATAGDSGTATAGEAGAIVLRHYDGQRWSILVGAVGKDGIEKGKPYHTLDGKTFVPGEHPGAKEAREYAARISAVKPVDRP